MFPALAVGPELLLCWMGVAPEQVLDPVELDPRADVWAFGLLAFHVLTGGSYWRDTSGELGAVASLASLGLWPENVSGLKVRVLLGAAASMAMLALGRGVFNSWLRAGRARGQFNRPIVIVGTNDEAAQLVDLLSTHGELGFKVVGVTGSREDYDEREWTVPFVGSLCDTLGALAAHVAAARRAVDLAARATRAHDLAATVGAAPAAGAAAS